MCQRKPNSILIASLIYFLYRDTIIASCFVTTVHPIQRVVHYSRPRDTCSSCSLAGAEQNRKRRKKNKKHHIDKQESFLEPWWLNKVASSQLALLFKEPWSEYETADSTSGHEPHRNPVSGAVGGLDESVGHNVTTRRNALKKVVSVTTSTILLPSNHNLPALAQDTSPSTSILTRPAIHHTSSTSSSVGTNKNIDCLLNLPPVAKDHARIYLCRHGQTENNRLRLVQGARVDPSINYNGRMQAIRLGEAISALKQRTESSRDFPTVALHSSLKRARETATVASVVVGNDGLSEDENVAFVNDLFLNESTSMNFVKYDKGSASSNTLLTLDTLSTLGEVDFGVVAEGQSVNEAKAEMMATFAQWAVGKIDARNGEDGETARDVLTRISLALKSMMEIASSNNGKSVMAVSHSTYLRMLLAMVIDVPLLQAASFEQKNCCINVLDVSWKETMEISYKSNIFGGGLSMAPRDFHLTIPKVQIIRMNEIRHLDGLF